jgi:putative ABC transport system substrate-binding protein
LALLVNPASPTAKLDAAELEAAGRTRGLRVQILNAGTRTEIDTTFAGLTQRGIDAVLVGTDPFFFSQRDQLVALAARHGMPMISYAREFVAAGGLMSYGVDIADAYRQGGSYVARVLKGEKPADLPVQQPTKFELVINLTAAKALGLNIPSALLARADEAIE